jgi:hypothetical protein
LLLAAMEERMLLELLELLELLAMVGEEAIL